MRLLFFLSHDEYVLMGVNKLHHKHSTASASYMYSICHIDNIIPLQVDLLFYVLSPCYTEVRSTSTSEYSPLYRTVRFTVQSAFS